MCGKGKHERERETGKEKKFVGLWKGNLNREREARKINSMENFSFSFTDCQLNSKDLILNYECMSKVRKSVSKQASCKQRKKFHFAHNSTRKLRENLIKAKSQKYGEFKFSSD